MQSSLKKSLYLGLAALSFASVAAVSTTASAKSYAKAGAYTTLTTDATKRNVEATGSNALYTKPGTVKGAKVVASKATMAKLATSKKSADYFRAYGQKVTNRGSVYYRVVTMNGKYRGYIYGGKAEGTFAGGIKAAETTTKATTPAKTAGYYLKDVSKNTIWTAPKNTQYKASKVNLYGATSTDPFTVDQAATKTREGSLYYHVTDTKDSSISGWIYAGKGYDATATTQDLGGLSLTASDATATSDNSIKIVYRDASTKAQVSSATWITSDTTTKAGDTSTDAQKNAAGLALSDFITNSKPANYALADTAATTGTYGTTLYVDVNAQATSKVQFTVSGTPNNTLDGASTATVLTTTPALANGDVLSASDLTVSGFNTALLTDAKGGTISDTNLGSIATSLTGAKIIGTKQYNDAAGNAYHYEYTLNNTGDLFTNYNTGSVYGSTLKASVTAQLVKTTTGSTSSDSSWIG